VNPERQQAIDYLRAPANGLWQWAENGAVLVWRDGSTIAFREEIVQILEWLAPNGLPSFGAIVFLLAACRGKVPAVEDIIVESKAALPTGMGSEAGILLTARQQLRVQLESALQQLGKLAQLPGELNSGLKAKCVLAEAVFEPAKAERYVQASSVLQGMRAPLGDAEMRDVQAPGPTGSYVRQIHIVAEGLKPHTAESLALRMRTGLDALPDEIDANLPSAERAQRLIEELSRDSEVGAVARAARELMAAVRLPRRLGERDELAIGGVADITNRGPLDRLLLSELAHDDLTLSVRVALNEALYLRREPPMREPPGTLALLLDSGVRLWGIPRVLATSVALALIACDKQHSEVRAWRAHGKKLQPLDLLTRKGLIQHLEALEIDAHSGEALPAFAEAITDESQNQSVLITSRDTLDDPAFRRSLADMAVGAGFVATVDRAGRFELHALPLAHRPPLCEADLDLEAVLSEKKGVSPRRTDIDPELPAIFGLPQFPFLLPVAGKLDYWVKAPDGFYYATLNERRLVRFRSVYFGAQTLATDLPPGPTQWMECVDGVVYLLKGAALRRPSRLVKATTVTESPFVTDLPEGPDVLAVHRYGGVILVIRRNDVRAYALNDGRKLAHKATEHLWVHGRFFRGGGKFYFAAWDGREVLFELVTTAIPASAIRLIFDRQGQPGPWLFCENGDVVCAESGERAKFPGMHAMIAHPDGTHVSKDGNQIFVYGADPGPPAKLFVLTEPPTVVVGRAAVSQFDQAPPLPVWNLFRIVESIAVIPEGLALCGKKNRWRKLALNEQGKLRIVEMPPPDKAFQRVFLGSQSTQTPHGCQLQTTKWPNGTKAFLDSRGLIHFKSHDPNVPEVSLVLSSVEVAGWTSDGHLCGPKFFFEHGPASEPGKVFECLQQILNL